MELPQRSGIAVSEVRRPHFAPVYRWNAWPEESGEWGDSFCQWTWPLEVTPTRYSNLYKFVLLLYCNNPLAANSYTTPPMSAKIDPGRLYLSNNKNRHFPPKYFHTNLYFISLLIKAFYVNCTIPLIRLFIYLHFSTKFSLFGADPTFTLPL